MREFRRFVDKQHGKLCSDGRAQRRRYDERDARIHVLGGRMPGDAEYLHNAGAIAKKGTINAADRELPFSGGRAVEGGTPFGWQLNQDGKPGHAFAAFAACDGGKVVVLGDAMATLLLGTSDGVRLTGVPRDPARTTYWGKDSAIFMEELLSWLARPPDGPVITRIQAPPTLPPCSVLIAEKEGIRP